METKEILAELDRNYKQTETKQEISKPKADKFNAVCILIFFFILYYININVLIYFFFLL